MCDFRHELDKIQVHTGFNKTCDFRHELDGGNTLVLNGGLHISLAVAAPPRKEVFFPTPHA
jgi:hypothetical protein